jgi:hypothetical protein
VSVFGVAAIHYRRRCTRKGQGAYPTGGGGFTGGYRHHACTRGRKTTDKLDIVGGDNVAIIIDDDGVRLASLESLIG